MVVRAGGVLLAFTAGFAVGTFIDDKVGVSHIAADTGHKVNEAYRDAGLPNFMAEASGMATTFAVANGGFLGVFLSEIVNDDEED